MDSFVHALAELHLPKKALACDTPAENNEIMMFTGIVLGLAPVAATEASENFLRYALELPSEWKVGLKIGASVAIDGVCQTVVKIDDDLVWFDAIEETLQKTTVAFFTVGRKVNIERALKAGDELGGHQLSGHVSDRAEIRSIITNGDNLQVEIGCDPQWMRYVLPKGFIGIDGISLTVGEVADDSFFLHLIPETRRITTLGHKQKGDLVNLEIDYQTQVIVTTIERMGIASGELV